jgi:hypothetical protein
MEKIEEYTNIKFKYVGTPQQKDIIKSQTRDII